MTPTWIHLQQSKKYLEALSWGGRFVIERNGIYGTRNEFKPPQLLSFLPTLIIEYFASSERPMLTQEQGIKILCWDRIEYLDKKFSKNLKESGFFRMRFIARPELYPVAYLDLRGLTRETYHNAWWRTHKNHKKKWDAAILEHKILLSEVSMEEFRDYYTRSTLNMFIRDKHLWFMKKLKEVYQDSMKFYFIRNKDSRILAGFCIVYDEDTKQSVYQFAFVYKEKEYKYVGVGLVAFCVEEALNRGFVFLNLTGVWEPGYPYSWKGFTAFKMQFAPRIVRCVGTFIHIMYIK